MESKKPPGRLIPKSSRQPKQRPGSSAVKPAPKTRKSPENPVWILGQVYDQDSESEAIAQHAASFLRFTYRRDFPPLSPYTISSDAGWGCMLRCAQMLLGHVLLRLALGENWRVPVNGAQVAGAMRLNSVYRRILRLFLDEPGPPHVFSLHHIVQAGMRYDKLPGEWFGPSTAALVLRDLVRVYQRHLRGKLAVYVTRGDVIYQTEAESLCRDASLDASLLAYASGDATEAVRVENLKRLSRRTQTRHAALQTVGHAAEPTNAVGPEDPDFFDPLMRPPPSATLPWASSLLLLVPLRLGVSSVLPDHMDELRFYLSCPSCVGILGGRPQHAIYFTGHSADGLLGLDPHTTFSAQHSRDPGASAFSADDASDNESPAAPSAAPFPSDALVEQLHVSRFVTLPPQQLDPSLAVGFCFRDRDAFAAFVDGVQRRAQQRLSEHREVLFQAAHAPPSYYNDDGDAAGEAASGDAPQDACDYDEAEQPPADAEAKAKGVDRDVLRLMLGSDYEDDARPAEGADGLERAPRAAAAVSANDDDVDDDFVFV